MAEETTATAAPQAPEDNAPALPEEAAEQTPAASENVRVLKDPATPDVGGFIWGTGRRKAAVARVRIRPSKDEKKPQFMVNGKRVDDFFTEMRDQQACRIAMKDADVSGIDVYCKVHGGGYMGQAQAIRLGVARALVGLDPQLETVLRDNGHLTRDPREVERKKYGQRGARRRFQFSKR